MLLTTAPQALPGSCYLCGSATRERFIDMAVSVEFHGAMYLCDLCVTEMATLLGFTSQEGLEALKKQVEDLQSLLFEAQTRADGYERAARGLMDAGACPDPATHLHPDSELRRLEDRIQADGASRAGASGVAGGEGTTDEPSDDDDVAGLRSDDVVSDSSRSDSFSLDLG